MANLQFQYALRHGIYYNENKNSEAPIKYVFQYALRHGIYYNIPASLTIGIDAGSFNMRLGMESITTACLCSVPL